MDLIERYIAAIRRNLPQAKADDIAAELRDDLQTRREDREEALGRPMTEEERSAMLREFGHPLVIAGRYRRQQYLIGPDAFPFYLFVLKVVLAIGMTLVAALAMVSIVLSDNQIVQRAMQAAGDVWTFFLIAIAVVTIVFAALERFGFPADHIAKWRPEQLPEPLEKPRSTWESAIEVGFGIAFLLWWTGVLAFPDLARSGGVRVEAGAVWDQYYLPILLIASVQLAVNVMKWLRPNWKVAASLLTIATAIATLAVIAGLQRAGSWVNVVATSPEAAQAERLGESVNLALQIALVVLAIMIVIQALTEIWKLARPRVQRLA